MDPGEELLHFGRQLQHLIRGCGVSAASVSLALGYHAQHLTRVLNGRRPMPVKLVFAIFKELHVFPHEFFDLVYPLGGMPEVLLRQEMSSRPRLPGFAEAAEAVRRLELESWGPINGEQAAEKLRAILRREILAARMTQRDISRRMGRGADALGQALRGNSELTFSHVFAVLAATGRSPGRIFAEVVSETPRSPVAQMALGRALDLLEELHQRLAAGWAGAGPSAAPAGQPGTSRGSDAGAPASKPPKPTKPKKRAPPAKPAKSGAKKVRGTARRPK